MALRLNRIRSSAPGETVREEEKRTGRGRLAAAIGETETEPEEKEERQSGRDRLTAAIERAETPETPSAVPASPAEPAAQQGRIRPGWSVEDIAPAQESNPTPRIFSNAVDRLKQAQRGAEYGTDPEAIRADLEEMDAMQTATAAKLESLSEPLQRANVAAQTYGSQVKAYETKLGMLSDTIANSEDPEERRRAQQEFQALDLPYQKAQRAAERYGAQANELNAQAQQLITQLQEVGAGMEPRIERYNELLSWGDRRAATLERQAEEIRNRQRSLGAGLYQMTPEQQDEYWAMGKQANDLEKAAARERGNYAQHLYNTQGADKANAYLSGAEAGNRAKAETNGFIGKVLNTAGGSGANWFSQYAGSPLILLAEIMGMHDEAEAMRASDPFAQEANRMSQNAGKLGNLVISGAGAAGHMMSMYGIGSAAAGALANTGLMQTLTGIAESSPLATSTAARMGARLASGLAGEFIGNAGNAAISFSSGVSGYTEARENGADFAQAMSVGIQKAAAEYFSNKLFSGMPLENAPGEKGYVTKAVEFLAGKLGKSEALAAFNKTTGGKILGWIYDTAGEGLEEVVTGLLDPIIDKMTYGKEGDWLPKLDQLADEFIGGVMLSLLMSGGEAALRPAMTRAQITEELVRQGVPKAEAQKYARMIYKDMKAAERAQKAVQEAVEAQEAGITEAPEAEPAEAANENTPPVPGAVQQNGPPVPGEVRNAAETAGTVQETEAIPQAAAENRTETRTETAESPTGRARLEAAMASEGQTETTAAQAPGEANAEAAGEKVTQRTLASERQKTAEKAASLRDAGFSTAGEDATARIRSEESWDAEEKAVGQALRDLGYEPTFAVGLIENAEGKSVPYLLEGNKLAVRSDHRNQSVQEIAEKAVGQALNIDQGVRHQVMETITQARAEAKAARQAAKKPAETPKVTARAQAAMDSARTAGASEEDGALAGRLADIIGRDIRFFNEAGKDGAWKNGYTQNGVIYLNAQAKKPVAWVVGHELTHNVEHSKIYDSLKKLAQKEMGLNWGLRVQSRLDASARIAQKLGDDSVRLTDPADAEREVVADFFADRLLSDEASIRRVCEYEPVTARNIRDYIKGLLRKLGGKETTLERALTLYNKALKDVAAKAQADAEGRMRLKGTESARPRTAVESVKKYSLNVETIDYAVNYTARNEEAKEQLRLLQKDITELGDIQDRINKEAGGRAAKNIHDLNDYLQAHPDVWQRLWDMQQELNDAGIRCDFVTEPGSPNVIDERQVPGGLKGLPIEYVESTTGKRYKFTAFWRNMPQMLLDSMSHDSREKLRTEIMKGVEDAYSRKTGERDLLPYFQDQFPGTKEIEKVAGDRTIKNIRNQTQSRVQSPIRDAEKTVAALNLNSACPMFTIGNNGCYLDACYLTQMANGATGTNLFRSAWYTGELLQISDADIRRMNELGGLRVNGVGDTTMDNKSQLKDALRHAGMRGLKVKMITKQRASLEVLAEMHEEGTDVSHVTVQPSMDNLWIPAKLDDVYGAGVRGTTQLAKTVEAGRNEAAATGYEEMFGRATKVVDGTLYRKYGFTPEQIREMQQDFPFVNITPRYVVCTAAEIAEIALNRNGEYVNGGKLIQTLMHGKVPAGCVSDYPGEIINFGGARHVVERKDGKWHFYGEFIGKGGLVGKIIDGPNTPYGKVQRYVEQNYTKAEQDKIWLTLKNQMCCQANDFKDACAGCQSLCARGCAAFSSEDFDYTKFSLRDKAKAMEMDEEPKTDGLQLKAAPEAQKQESGLRLGGMQYSVAMASDLYRTENDFTESMPADEFREKIKAESRAESYFPKGLSEKFMKAIAGKGTFNRTKLYRGIDAAEMDFLMENKYLQSNGSYNFQNQQGQTLADEDPGYALSYATGFAPKDIADKHYKDGMPSYLVEFLNSPNLNVSKNEVQESYTYDQIGQDYITRIFEIEYDPETQQDMVRDVTEEMRAHLPDMGKGLAETAHGRPMFFRDKTTGTIVYAVQGADGWENGKYISEKDPSMTWSYEQMNSPVFSKHAPAMLGVSGNEADLEAMEVGPDGELVPEKKVQFSAEDSDDEYRQAPGTEALDKLGIRLAGSKGKYHLAEQLLERDKAAKELMNATKKAEKKLKATKAEKEFAAGIAAGIYEERDIPSSMNKDTVATLADYYAAEESFKANMLAEVRGRINAEYQDEAEELLANVDHFKKLSMLMLNERTPDRTFRAMFGPTQGKAIFDWLIRPVQMNEAAKTRWHQEQLDKVRQFEDSKGKTRALTRAESELTMLVMEGKAAAAAVADMEKKGLDAKGIRNAAENIRNGEDAADAAWEFGLKDKERELARNYARWMDTQEKLKSADSTIIDNAAEAYSKIFDEFYDGINDFLVAHGYEPIGYIKGYAPHMQPEETQSLLEKAFDKMGISLGNDKAQGLPASIAGETAYFKPNKRWDPYFLHRTGTHAEYDIEKAYQSYVGYLSDILFHTDDIMRVRNMERMIRKTYASDEIKENLDWIQEIRNSPSEERLGMLRDAGKIGKTTILSGSEVNDKLDEWEEEEFNALKEDRQYNNLVMWLSNYANILAGKQSFADRGWEYSLGRNSLNFANRLQAAFQRSLVAGSLTSALNQTAQLPMIKAELGDRWYYAALKDILTGQTRGFWKDSDFLTGKHGVDMLYTDNYDKFISALFKPSTAVDYIVSTTAVRGAFLKAIHQGQSYSEAMRTADDFGRRVMGSREKGTRPLAYESKGLFSRMIHMFQVEAANSWDHIASDLPYEIKEIARTQGKPKAALTLGVLLLRGLLSAFVLNRLTEELYGGTPAPFDVIGLAMNFVASGQGMTTNRYLKTIIDNGLEKIGSDRFFGTEDVDAEFDVGKGLEELGYNVMNDVPLLRNLAGVLGLGDQTVPLPGAGGEFKDLKTAVEDLIEDGADMQEVNNALWALGKLLMQFVPAGRQLTKTAEGVKAVIQEGSYSKKENLQYPIDTTADKIRAIFFGKNATNAARDHWASGEGTLSEKQTALVKTMREWGVSGADAVKIVRKISKIKQAGGSQKEAVVEYIGGLTLTSEQKDQIYLAQNYAESELGETPWHAKGGGSGRGKTYSMGGLRLPTPERREPISSGLRLPSTQAQKPSTGGLKLK